MKQGFKVLDADLHVIEPYDLCRGDRNERGVGHLRHDYQ